jgi:hypothetical protein
MNYELPEQLCIQIYEYLEKQPSIETGIMYAMLDQAMKQQNIDKQKKDAKDKMRAEIDEEAKKSIEEAAKKAIKPKKGKDDPTD